MNEDPKITNLLEVLVPRANHLRMELAKENLELTDGEVVKLALKTIEHEMLITMIVPTIVNAISNKFNNSNLFKP